MQIGLGVGMVQEFFAHSVCTTLNRGNEVWSQIESWNSGPQENASN